MDETFDRYEAAKAQAEYCKETGMPHFAPKTGTCWKCNKNIYEQVERKSFYSDNPTYKTGISVEKAGSSLVTGCPHCSRSYCD